MLDHIFLTVSDFAPSLAFYRRALAPLGTTNYVDYDGENGHPDLKGFGRDKRAFLWLKAGEPSPGAVHFALVAESRAVDNAFYKEAIAAGARDNISPRIREEYDPMYFAADILDPDGYSVEVVIKS